MNKVQKINSADKGSLHQWLQGVFFVLYDCNSGPVDETDIDQSLVAIGREFPFLIELSPERSREGNLEAKQDLDHFEASSPILFRQRKLFNTLVSERRIRHRDLRNKGNFMRESDTRDLVVVRKQVKSSIKDRIDQTLLFKIKGPYRVLEKAKPGSYWIQHLNFGEGLEKPGRKLK